MRNLFILLCLAFLTACSTSKKSSPSEVLADAPHGAGTSLPLILYKTKGDYRNNVPVSMDDKNRYVVAWPDRSRLPGPPSYSAPTAMPGGYLMANTEVTDKTAFLKYTYEKYMSFEKTPGPESMRIDMLDKDPFTELIICGERNEMTIQQAKELIAAGELRLRCKVIK